MTIPGSLKGLGKTAFLQICKKHFLTATAILPVSEKLL